MGTTVQEAAKRLDLAMAERRTEWARRLTPKWDAGVHPEHGVVVYWHERIWRVVGGDATAPSLHGLVGVRVGDVAWVERRERQEPAT